MPPRNRTAAKMMDCLMLRSRMISRKLTALYEDELRELGIKGSQLNVLAAIAATGPIRRTEIGRMLALDASTLSRNLAVMLENGWLAEDASGADGRGAPVRITPAGETLLTDAYPRWEAAHRRATRLVGGEAKDAFLALTPEIPTP